MPYYKQPPLTKQLTDANANLQKRLPAIDQREYMIIYLLAKQYTSQPRECVFVLRQLPEACDCAHSIRLARLNRMSTKAMINRLRDIIKTTVSTLSLEKAI